MGAGLSNIDCIFDRDQPSVFPTWLHLTFHLWQGPQAVPSFLKVQASFRLLHLLQGVLYIGSSVVTGLGRLFDLALLLVDFGPLLLSCLWRDCPHSSC